MRPGRIAPAAFRRGAERIARDLDRERDALLRSLLYRARGLSTGRYSSAQLGRMGHPYRHGGSPPMDPSVINRQSGLFARSWRAERGGITNTAPEASFLFAGTRRMIRRPILDRLAAWLRTAAPRRLADRILQTFRP